MGGKYVVWLSSEEKYGRGLNVYGYWSGKSYSFDREAFPITDS